MRRAIVLAPRHGTRVVLEERLAQRPFELSAS
jgi:hypothetical protein